MRFALSCVCLVLLLSSSSCRKSAVTNELAPIRLGECGAQMLSGNNVSICYNELLEESRCPPQAVCIWQGVAMGSFTFKAKGQEASFSLATLDMSSKYRRDTTLFGYKIHLVDLLPYPGSSNSHPVAKLEITE